MIPKTHPSQRQINVSESKQSPDTIRKAEHIHSVLIASQSPLKLTTMGG